MQKALEDDLIMSLVGQALSRPPEERESYIRSACDKDPELLHQVWDYVQSEGRMDGFLQRPLLECFAWPLPDPRLLEQPFQSGERVLGRFLIVRQVAEGGMGIVYEAEDERLHRRVAIKCAKAGFGNRLPPEVRHASEISHANVCKIFDIHTAATAQGEIDFLTMEFLEGETLAARLVSGEIRESEVPAMANQLCAGLAAAHRNGVIHGDLKSNNVILTQTPDGAVRAVITDFGLARKPGSAVSGSAGEHGMPSAPVGGSRAYMAPELLHGGKATTASDVYALGVILSELIFGRRPQATAEEQPMRKLPKFQNKWESIIARCLNPDPAQRFADAGRLVEALKPQRTGRLLTGVIAALLLAGVSGAITFQRATAPIQTVRLAFVPFSSGRDSAQAARLSRDTAAQLGRIRGTAHTRFVFIPASEVVRKKADTVEKTRKLLSATYVLHGTLEEMNGDEVLHAYLTDTRSGVKTEDWEMPYQLWQLRYAPVAVAGMVTNALRTAPLITNARVNAAAQKDYVTGVAYVRSNIRPDDSVMLLERAVSADPDSPLTYAGLAEAQWFKYFLTHDARWKEKARESVRQAELRNPDLPEVHMVSGWLKKNSTLYEQAEKDFQRVIELQPDNGDAYRRLGMTYDSSGLPGDALTALEKAAQIRPYDLDNHRALGSFYIERSQYKEALGEFQKMAQIAPDRSESHYLLGTAFLELGRKGEAERELRKAVSIEDRSDAEQVLAFLLVDARKNQEAAVHYSRAIKIGPQTALLWLSLGLCYGREGRKHDAQEAFGRGLQLAEKALMEDSRDGRERANLAYLEARLGDGRRAESDIGQALQSPRDDDTLSMAVLTYEALGQREQSLALLKRSPSILPQLTWFPELADLRSDSRFTQLLASNHDQ